MKNTTLIFNHWKLKADHSPTTHQDFNGSSGDLGGDSQSLEEGGLLWTEPGVLSRDGHLTRGDGTSTGSSGHLAPQTHEEMHSSPEEPQTLTRSLSATHFVCQQQIPDLSQILLGEDEAHVPTDVRKQPAKHESNIHLEFFTV